MGLSIPIGQDFVISWTGGSGLVQVTLGDIANGDVAVCFALWCDRNHCAFRVVRGSLLT